MPLTEGMDNGFESSLKHWSSLLLCDHSFSIPDDLKQTQPHLFVTEAQSCFSRTLLLGGSDNLFLLSLPFLSLTFYLNCALNSLGLSYLINL